MTTPVPVVLPEPPLERPQPRVVVTRHRGSTNSGDGRGERFVVRFVVDGRTKLLSTASAPAGAARRGAAFVRQRRPRAVWLLDITQAGGRWSSDEWTELARAAGKAQAAFVAWSPHCRTGAA